MRQRGGECKRWDTGGCGGEQRSGNYNGESSERVLPTPSPISRQFLQTKSSEANKGEKFWEALVEGGEGRKEYLSPLKSWQETATTLLKELFKGRRSWAVDLSRTSTPSPAHSPVPCPEGFGFCCLSRLWNAPKLLSLGAQLCQILIQLFWRERCSPCSLLRAWRDPHTPGLPWHTQNCSTDKSCLQPECSDNQAGPRARQELGKAWKNWVKTQPLLDTHRQM